MGENPATTTEAAAATMTATATPPREQHPPRAAGARAKRYAWTEPRPRFWLIVAAVILAADIYLFVRQQIVYRRETWLWEHGIKVDAEITHVDGATPKGQGY